MATAMQSMWAMIQSIDTFERLYEDDHDSPPIGLVNANELTDATRKFCEEPKFKHIEHIGLVPLPDDFPHVVLKLPDRGFAPDYMEPGGHHLVSRRMREAMALPPEVVQYRPVVLYSPTTDGAAQDYRELRLLVQQPAMDLERSSFDGNEFNNARTGARMMNIRTVNRFVLREGFRPRFDLFLLGENRFTIMATDALAERVMQAGCTSVVFIEPAGSFSGGHYRSCRYRTADGVAQTLPGEPI